MSGALRKGFKPRDLIWPVIGLLAVAVSAWLLYKEVRGLSLDDVIESLEAISGHEWMLAAGGTLVAYTALALYDALALQHLERKLPWRFIALCSFTTYALAHNFGASVLSGAVVRYRAYTSQGLSAAEVGVLVALCSFTFVLGTVLLSGFVLLIVPEIAERLSDHLPIEAARGMGIAMLALVLLYVFGSWLHLKPWKIGSFQLVYPRLPIVMRQLIIAPLELIGAASIIYFALPAEGNPGFLIVLGIFLASFSVALLSHAPGGLGVLEVVFLAGLPDMRPADVIAALLVFRLFYLIIPFALSLVVVLLFEHSQFARHWAEKTPKSGDESTASG
ncbi:MAG: lysylphosphatidylglycerol synthase domain-containing protein [Parvibaculaceae bacterium]